MSHFSQKLHKLKHQRLLPWFLETNLDMMPNHNLKYLLENEGHFHSTWIYQKSIKKKSASSHKYSTFYQHVQEQLFRIILK